MKPLKSDNLYGSWATLLLPIQHNDRIDFGRLAEEINYLVEAGVNGIYSNGTAGEFYTQTEVEYNRINQLLAECCESRQVAFQIGASHASPQLSLDRIRRAVMWKPSAIQVILPDWVPLHKDEEVIDCLKYFAEAANPIGIVLYNPPHAKRVLSPESYTQIKKAVPGLIGIKVAGGDASWYEAMKKHAQGISVFVPGHLLATGYSRGAQGAYSNIACLSPAGAQNWYESMTKDLPAALLLEERIRMFMADYIVPFVTTQHYSNAAVDKLLAAIGDWGSSIGTGLRWPYRSIPKSEADRLRPIAKEMLPEMFS